MDVTSVKVERITYHVNNGLQYAVRPSAPPRSTPIASMSEDVSGKTRLGVWVNPVPRAGMAGRLHRVRVAKLSPEKGSDYDMDVSYLPSNVEFEDMIAHRIGASLSKFLHHFWSFLCPAK